MNNKRKIIFLFFYLNLIYVIIYLNYKNKIELKNENILLDQNQNYIDKNGQKYPKFIPLYENKSIDFKLLNSSKKIKTILMWNKFLGAPLLEHYVYGTIKPFEDLNCPVTNCELTNDRNMTEGLMIE